jgi:uncharacterized protein
MMNEQDRAAIDGLFQKLAQVSRQGVARDPEAERLIAARIAEMPGAAYYMAQTIIVQEQALQQAEQRLEEAENAPPAQTGRGGGFMSSIWGSSNRAEPRSATPMGRGSVPNSGAGYNAPGAAPGFGAGAGAPGMAARGGGGGFLAGAAQTAMGVAGGVLLGSAIGSMFGGGNEAQAAEGAAGATPAADTAGNEDAGGGVEQASDEGGGGGFFDSFFGGDDSGGDFGSEDI